MSAFDATLPRVAFAGSAEFALPSLAALADAGYPIVGVVTQPDRPAGRGRLPHASPVKHFAVQRGLPLAQPEHWRDPAALATLRGWAPDVFVVIAYGLLLPSSVLAVPPRGCINVHGSLLPRWRGAAPVARAIQAGDMHAGVSIMQMVAALDAGPVFTTRSLTLSGRETAGELTAQLAELGATALLAVLPAIVAGTAAAQPQDPALVSYAAKLDKAEATLDWTRPALELQRQVLAFNPWPVAESMLAGERLRIWRADVADSVAAATRGVADGTDSAVDGTDSGGKAPDKRVENAPPGTVVVARGDDFIVATGDRGLRLDIVQAPGKRAMSAREFLAGRSVLGLRFEP